MLLRLEIQVIRRFQRKLDWLVDLPLRIRIPRIGIKVRASKSRDLTIRASPLTHSI
jgi:hypothetical protein